jgi:hypothetical protein
VIRNCPPFAPTFASKTSKILAGSGTDVRHRRGWILRDEAYWPWSASSIGTTGKTAGRDITPTYVPLRILPTPSRFLRV